jgi:hypothetical protein
LGAASAARTGPVVTDAPPEFAGAVLVVAGAVALCDAGAAVVLDLDLLPPQPPTGTASATAAMAATACTRRREWAFAISRAIVNPPD